MIRVIAVMYADIFFFTISLLVSLSLCCLGRGTLVRQLWMAEAPWEFELSPPSFYLHMRKPERKSITSSSFLGRPMPGEAQKTGGVMYNSARPKFSVINAQAISATHDVTLLLMRIPLARGIAGIGDHDLGGWNFLRQTSI